MLPGRGSHWLPYLRVESAASVPVPAEKGRACISLSLLIHIALSAKLSNEPLLDSHAQGNPVPLVEPYKYS